MLSPDKFQVVRAKQLKPGQLAFLIDRDMEPVLIGEANEYHVAIFFQADGDRSNTKLVEELEGAALLFEEWEPEVDWTGVEKLDHMENRHSALVIAGTSLSIIAAPPSRGGYIAVKIRDLPQENSSIAYGFRHWKLVHPVGEDRCETLIEYPSS